MSLWNNPMVLRMQSEDCICNYSISHVKNNLRYCLHNLWIAYMTCQDCRINCDCDVMSYISDRSRKSNMSHKKPIYSCTRLIWQMQKLCKRLKELHSQSLGRMSGAMMEFYVVWSQYIKVISPNISSSQFIILEALKYIFALLLNEEHSLGHFKVRN